MNVSFCTVSFITFYNELKEFFNFINPTYSVKLDEALQNGMLNLGEDIGGSKYDSSNLKPFSTIDIQREYTWMDAFVCIHEFFHYLNDDKTLNRDIFTEFISIYFEISFYDYLINKGILVDFPIISNRIIDTFYTSVDFMKYSLEFLLFKEVGDLDEFSYQYAPKISSFTVSKEVYDRECIYLLKKCRNMEVMMQKRHGSKAFNKNEFEEMVIQSFLFEYKYIIGTFLALYMRKHGSIEKMIWLNENVNQENLSPRDLLKKVGIDITDSNTKEEIQKCLREEIEKNSISSKQR